MAAADFDPKSINEDGYWTEFKTLTDLNSFIDSL
jgi:hypothetical protein